MQKQLISAAQHLSTNDPKLAAVIAHAGLATFAPHQNYYQSLCGSIISQQLSIKAAATIEHRFKDLFEGDWPAPEAILKKSIEQLRSVGLSGAKANYIRDLAEHIIDGRLKFNRLESQSNQEIIANLTDVKGIGEWTVHMFLMFCMGRLDVLATGDLGVRNGVGKLYGFESVPTPQVVKIIAERNNWHPYESVACWYIWHSLDNKPAV